MEDGGDLREGVMGEAGAFRVPSTQYSVPKTHCRVPRSTSPIPRPDGSVRGTGYLVADARRPGSVRSSKSAAKTEQTQACERKWEARITAAFPRANPAHERRRGHCR